jgi:hypothetical protein
MSPFLLSFSAFSAPVQEPLVRASTPETAEAKSAAPTGQSDPRLMASKDVASVPYALSGSTQDLPMSKGPSPPASADFLLTAIRKSMNVASWGDFSSPLRGGEANQDTK